MSRKQEQRLRVAMTDSERMDWLERAAEYAVLLSGSERDGGFYVSTGTAYTRGLRPSLREAIDALASKDDAA